MLKGLVRRRAKPSLPTAVLTLDGAASCLPYGASAKDSLVPVTDPASLPSAQPITGPAMLSNVKFSDSTLASRQDQETRSRKLLYDLVTPNLADYQYEGKLVPPPPIAFGRFSPSSLQLGFDILVNRNYNLVREAVSTDYFFELNDLYMEIVFLGQANSGKSSLLNALTQQPLARTSSLPNSTRRISFYQSVSADEARRLVARPDKLVKLPGKGRQLTLVDVPGFGIDGMSDSWADSAIACTDAYLGTRRSVNTVFLCVDAERGWTPTDAKYLKWIQNVHGVLWVLLTRCDAVSHSQLCSTIVRVYAEITKSKGANQKVYPFVLPVSSHSGANLDQLRALIAETSGLAGLSSHRSALNGSSPIETSLPRRSNFFNVTRQVREGTVSGKEGRQTAALTPHSTSCASSNSPPVSGALKGELQSEGSFNRYLESFYDKQRKHVTRQPKGTVDQEARRAHHNKMRIPYNAHPIGLFKQYGAKRRRTSVLGVDNA